MKLVVIWNLLIIFVVAPFTGAWIETVSLSHEPGFVDGRTLHGCVD